MAQQRLERSGYATSDVARLLGMPLADIRAWVRDGLVRPARAANGELVFAFQDLVLLRTLQRLVRDVPRGKLRKAVRGLRERALGADLTGIRLDAEAGDVVVVEPEATWTAASGQLVFVYDVEDPTSE